MIIHLSSRLLCTEKGDTLVKYATAGLDPNIFVQKYMIELPSEEEIKKIYHFLKLLTNHKN